MTLSGTVAPSPQPRPDMHAPALQLDFSVSQNEEHVTLQLSTTHARLALGERTHHYSLLALARQRLHDARRGLDPTSQGWIETERLALSLGLDAAHLNIHIFRARSQFRAAARQAGHAGELIERRRGELRFGEFSFRIVRGSLLEGIFQSATASAHGENESV